MKRAGGEAPLGMIAPLQGEIDGWIATAAEDFLRERLAESAFRDDLRAAQEELLGLSQGKDVCYDRPAIAPAYSLWYQGQRINQALAALAAPFAGFRGERIDIFDLGAGAGTVLTAAILLRWAMLEGTGEAPAVRVVNIDSSPFMLDYGRRFLRKESVPGKFQSAMEPIEAEYEVCAWQNARSLVDADACWICASYLFDHQERASALAGPFKDLLAAWKPDLLWLSTSTGKRGHLDTLASEFRSIGGEPFEKSNAGEPPFKGPMERVNRLRDVLRDCYSVAMKNDASWEANSAASVLLQARSPELRLRTTRPRGEPIAIYQSPIRVRRQVPLNQDQLKAARHSGRPRLVTGPAGSGKSLVITEAVKQAVDHHRGDASGIRILVTTFNKAMVACLKDWLANLLGTAANIDGSRANPHFSFDLGGAHIQLMHFDVLPTRLGDLGGNRIETNERRHEDLMRKAINEIITTSPPTVKDPFADPAYILDEFHRVLYGQQIEDQTAYFASERVGRGPGKLRKDGPTRKFLWLAMERYRQALEAKRSGSFVTQRWDFLRRLRSGDGRIDRFDYLFVDEYQDCTPADFEIFYLLLKDPNGIMVAGDLAQAVHLGKSASSPRERGDRNQSPFSRETLRESYRLPYWICRAIRPFSERAFAGTPGPSQAPEETPATLEAWKGAPPGARPLVVYGEDSPGLAESITTVIRDYQPFDPGEITILEQDTALAKAMHDLGGDPVVADSILRLKGLEKRVIIWSTRVGFPGAAETDEIAYTILTRTSCLLIIALSPETRPEFQRVLAQLDRDFLIFRDERARQKFEKLARADRS